MTHRGQISDSFGNFLLLSASGGLQDAYTYFARGHVFANAQTGNIVLLSQELFSGNWSGVVRYLIPVFCFALGVMAAEIIRFRWQRITRLHWRQLVLAVEIVLLFAVGFLPSTLDLLANSIVSFSCAMQVQSFRKIEGRTFASTMCIGNLRSGVESLFTYFRTKERTALRQFGRYLTVIALFCLGAGVGGLCIPQLGLNTIWLCCGLLLVSFVLMFHQTGGE